MIISPLFTRLVVVLLISSGVLFTSAAGASLFTDLLGRHFAQVIMTGPSFVPSSYIGTLRKAKYASLKSSFSPHTVKCMLFKGLWQCVSEGEKYMEPRKMHHLIWTALAEAIEISTRDVAEEVSSRFESQRVRERVAEQTISKMILLLMPCSRVLHARNILHKDSDRITSVVMNGYDVVHKDSPLLVLNNAVTIKAEYDAFSLSNPSISTWNTPARCAARGFIVYLTDEFEMAEPKPFDRTRLLRIFQRFLQKKYSTVIANK